MANLKPLEALVGPDVAATLVKDPMALIEALIAADVLFDEEDGEAVGWRGAGANAEQRRRLYTPWHPDEEQRRAVRRARKRTAWLRDSEQVRHVDVRHAAPEQQNPYPPPAGYESSFIPPPRKRTAWDSESSRWRDG